MHRPVISTGNRKLAIKPTQGTAYWNSINDNTSLSITGIKGLFGTFADIYDITRSGCIWLQGETDCRMGMTAEKYTEFFLTCTDVF